MYCHKNKMINLIEIAVEINFYFYLDLLEGFINFEQIWMCDRLRS